VCSAFYTTPIPPPEKSAYQGGLEWRLEDAQYEEAEHDDYHPSFQTIAFFVEDTVK
jgi:hypothetical protein